MFNYEQLDIWKDAIQYAKLVYKITQGFPREEMYGLTNQLRRAVVSISSNIAEGSGSTTLKDKLHYLDIAIKSTLETTSQVSLALELEYINSDQKVELYESGEKIIRKIRAYKRYLNQS